MRRYRRFNLIENTYTSMSVAADSNKSSLN